MSDADTPLTLGFTVTSTPNTPEQIAWCVKFAERVLSADDLPEMLDALGITP